MNPNEKKITRKLMHYHAYQLAQTALVLLADIDSMDSTEIEGRLNTIYQERQNLVDLGEILHRQEET